MAHRGAPGWMAAALQAALLPLLLGPAPASAQPPLTRYVSHADPTCAGHTPCYATIQAAVTAAQPGDTVQILAGTYVEQVQVQGKNNFSGANETHRLVIQADPALPPGAVVVAGAVGQCTQGYAIRFQQSKFVTLRGVTLTGAGDQAVSPPATTSYTYNVADQLLAEDGISYTYDLAGRLTGRTDGTGTTTYLYDFENRLVRVTTPAGTTTYAYDADGNRVEKTDATGTTRFLVDTNRDLAQVLAEYTPAGTLVASYVYADELISTARGGQAAFYHPDGLGSTRLLTDPTGSVTDRYTYSAFGELQAHTGSSSQPYGFVAEPFEPSTGLAYHRARWMDPRVGRFTSVDPHGGHPAVPSSFHPYAYAGLDPVNHADPSGLFTQQETVKVLTIAQILWNEYKWLILTSAGVGAAVPPGASLLCAFHWKLSEAGYDPTPGLHVAGCEEPENRKTAYRFIAARWQKIDEKTFRFDPPAVGTDLELSLNEQPPPPPAGRTWRCAYPFRLKFRGDRVPGTDATMESHGSAGPLESLRPAGGRAVYTPPPEGHWSAYWPGRNVRDIQGELVEPVQQYCRDHPLGQ